MFKGLDIRPGAPKKLAPSTPAIACEGRAHTTSSVAPMLRSRTHLVAPKLTVPLRILMASCVAVALSLSFAGTAVAGTDKTFTVTTTADSGAGSLRQAILDSNANRPLLTNTIQFAIPGS